MTYYGTDNQIDGIVLDVLLRKHKSIRHSLGISVPLPANSNDVVKALMNGLLLRGGAGEGGQLSFGFVDDMARELALKWDAVSEREQRSRSLFAQHTMDLNEVAQEWQAVRHAIGAGGRCRALRGQCRPHARRHGRTGQQQPARQPAEPGRPA